MELINDLEINSFKSIAKTEINLGRVNFFIGSNGSGKSNLLEAIGVLSAAANGKVDDDALKSRGVRPGRPRIYKSAFRDSRMEGHIALEAQTKSCHYRVSLHNPLKSPEESWYYKTEDFSSDSDKFASRAPRSQNKESISQDRGKAALALADLASNNPASIFLRRLQDYAIFTPFTPVLRGAPFPDGKTRSPVGLYGERLPDAIEEYFKHIENNEDQEEQFEEILQMLDWVKSFDTHTSASELLSPSVSRGNRVIRFTDRYMRDDYNRLTGFDASEGALYILYMAMLALHPQAPDFFAIDNFDQALNPRMTRALVRNFCKWILKSQRNSQVLCTTHNPLALDGLPLNNPDVRLFAVERDGEGKTVIRKLDFDYLKEQHDKTDLPISRMWVMGLLGGVPDV